MFFEDRAGFGGQLVQPSWNSASLSITFDDNIYSVLIRIKRDTTFKRFIVYLLVYNTQ